MDSLRRRLKHISEVTAVNSKIVEILEPLVVPLAVSIILVLTALGIMWVLSTLTVSLASSDFRDFDILGGLIIVLTAVFYTCYLSHFLWLMIWTVCLGWVAYIIYRISKGHYKKNHRPVSGRHQQPLKQKPSRW